jgi:hypothetical protein
MNMVTVEMNFEDRRTQKFMDVVSVDPSDEKYFKIVRANNVVMIRHSFILSVTVDAY